VVVACCLIGACHAVSEDTPAASGGGGSSASVGEGAPGGNASDGSMHAGGSGGTSAAGHPAVGSGEAGQAGEAGGGNEAGDASGAAGTGDAGTNNTPTSTTPLECDLDGGCASNCTGETVSCEVESFASACEFELFHDTPATVTCGRTATVGIANCGACGSVAVEVYYDGSHCWQGIPDCQGPLSFGKFFDPHAPLP